ncbi:MAG: SDR family NAD(P)-dependent oxidoreductase [Candidatus Thorarchaeota archaeon]
MPPCRSSSQSSEVEGGILPRLRDRVAVVTGAARGIGSGIARAMAGEGAVVVLWDILGLVEETAQSIRSSAPSGISHGIQN